MRRHDVASLGTALALALIVGSPVAASPNSNAANGQALLNALNGGDEPLAITLIDKHTDVNSRDEMGVTPLIWAAEHSSVDLVERLLKAGADPNILCETGLGPLQIAIANHADAIAILLLDHGAKANIAREDGETVLMTAARTGQLEVMTQLIARGADVNAHEDEFNQTALMWSAGYPSQANLLIHRGADIRARTKIWEITNPIYTAAYPGHPEPWASDGEYVSRKGGQSALFFAVQKDDIESVRALLDAGLDVNDLAADGTSALLLALYKWGHGGGKIGDAGGAFHSDMPFKPNLTIANLLLDRGANVNFASAEGYTPLHVAVLGLVPPAKLAGDAPVFDPTVAAAKPPVDPREGVALVQRLLELKANVNAVTRYPTPGPLGAVRISRVPPGSSPLHIAALSGNAELVGVLLARGGDPNLIRKDGHSPLSIAVKANDLGLVSILVAGGADVKRIYNPNDLFADPGKGVSNSGILGDPRANQTIMHIAAGAGAYSVVAFLAKHGVPLNARNDRGETPLVLADTQEQARYIMAKSYEEQELESNPAANVKHAVRATDTSDAIRSLVALNRVSSTSPTRSMNVHQGALAGNN